MGNVRRGPRKVAVGRDRPPIVDAWRNGFVASWLCHPLSPDCQHGNCWHMGVMRSMIHRWFDRLNPIRAGGAFQEPPPSPPKTKAELKDEEQVNAIARLIDKRRYDPLPETETPYAAWGGPSFGCIPRLDGEKSDLDGNGSWGHCVRVMEDVADER